MILAQPRKKAAAKLGKLLRNAGNRLIVLAKKAMMPPSRASRPTTTASMIPIPTIEPAPINTEEAPNSITSSIAIKRNIMVALCDSFIANKPPNTDITCSHHRRYSQTRLPIEGCRPVCRLARLEG
jgi:hypothetical protein